MKTSVTKIGTILSGLVPTLFLSQAAIAQDNATTFWVDHDILQWNQTKNKPDNGSTTTDSGLVTTPNDVTIGIFWKQFGLYVTPGNAGGNVGLSYYVQKEVEIGLLLGVNNSETELGNNKTENEASSYGLFGTYYLGIDAASSAEFTLSYVHSNNKQTTETTTGTTTTTTTTNDSKSDGFTIAANYVYQIAPHFNFVPGIAYAANTVEAEVAAAPTAKSKSNGLTLNLVHFRYTF